MITSVDKTQHSFLTGRGKTLSKLLPEGKLSQLIDCICENTRTHITLMGEGKALIWPLPPTFILNCTWVVVNSVRGRNQKCPV